MGDCVFDKSLTKRHIPQIASQRQPFAGKLRQLSNQCL
jgi:hypothetical protein